MKIEYQLSEEDFQQLLACSKPVPYMVFGGIAPRSPQEIANDCWAALGRKMSFQWETVEPSPKGDRFFLAEPSAPRPQEHGKE